MQLGMIGLGRMGANIVRRLMRDGHECVVYDVSADVVKQMEAEGATGAGALEEFASKLTVPRAAWIMGPAAYAGQTATTGFQAGLECERFRPHVLLLDLHLGDNNDADRVANLVHTSDNLQMTKIVPMSGKLTDGQAAALSSKGFEGFLRKPFQVRQVVESIESATAMVY